MIKLIVEVVKKYKIYEKQSNHDLFKKKYLRNLINILRIKNKKI